tara:strand:- start:408 stop:611 length:204 start_codon:yes stop_codon:yes gene_type:complete
MKETAKVKKVNKGPDKYKAVNNEKFAAMFTDVVPFYKELSKGESVTLNLKNKHVKYWLENKIIVKEN